MRLAVVGNSRDVLNHAAGAAIDACDLVIRINSFRTEGHEGSVGSRVDVVSICLAPWVVRNALPSARHEIARAAEVWTPSWRGQATDSEVADAMRAIDRDVDELVFSDDTGHKQLMLHWYLEVYARAAARPGPKTEAPDGKRFLPTTGFLTLQLALARYPGAEVFITGFGLCSEPDEQRFDWSGVAMWPGHDLPTERSLLLRGIEQGLWRRMEPSALAA